MRHERNESTKGTIGGQSKQHIQHSCAKEPKPTHEDSVCASKTLSAVSCLSVWYGSVCHACVSPRHSTACAWCCLASSPPYKQHQQSVWENRQCSINGALLLFIQPSWVLSCSFLLLLLLLVMVWWFGYWVFVASRRLETLRIFHPMVVPPAVAVQIPRRSKRGPPSRY